MSILQGKRRAVIVGINRYKRATEDNIQILTGAENDAQEICDRLKKIDTCNFDISANHLLIGENATYERIRIAISDLLWKTGFCDIALFYFSGHGIVDNYGVGYLAPYDMYKNDPTVFGLKIQDLKDTVRNSVDKKTVILILDCCYSGLAAKGDPKADFDRNLDAVGDGEGRIILASTEADAVSREVPDYTHNNKQVPHPHGIFTSYLIDGLDGDAADTDGIITIDGLRKYLDNKMTDVKKQKPRHSISEGSKTEHIRIGLVPDTYYKYIENELIEVQNILERNKERINVGELYIGALKVRNVLERDKNNHNGKTLKEEVDKILKRYDGPITEWLRTNARSRRTEIDDISKGLYFQLTQLENNLSFEKFIVIKSELTLELLEIFCDQIDFQSPEIDSVIRRMKVAIKNRPVA